MNEVFRGPELLKAAGRDLHYHSAPALLARRSATLNHAFLSSIGSWSVIIRSSDDIRRYWAFGGCAVPRGRTVMWPPRRTKLGCASSRRAPVAPDLIEIHCASCAREGVAILLVPHVCKRCVVAAYVAREGDWSRDGDVLFDELQSAAVHIDRYAYRWSLICRCRLLVRLRMRCFGRTCRARSRELTAGVVCVRMRTTCGERRPAYRA